MPKMRQRCDDEDCNKIVEVGCEEMSVEKNVEGERIKYNGCEGRRGRAKAMTTKLVKAAKRGNAINNASSNRPPETERTLHATNNFSQKDVKKRKRGPRDSLGHRACRAMSSERQRAGREQGSNTTVTTSNCQDQDLARIQNTLCDAAKENGIDPTKGKTKTLGYEAGVLHISRHIAYA